MRVLLVEDHVMILDNMAVVLSQYGWFPVRTTSAEDALTFLQKSPKPEVILADLYLEGMTGLDLLRQVRANPEWADIPFILTTAASDHDCDKLRTEFFDKLNGQRIMRKPFTQNELIANVEEVTGLKGVTKV